MHATIESIVRRSESEPSKPRRAERQRRTVCEPWGVTRFGEANTLPKLFLVIGSVSVTLNTNEKRPRYE